MEAGAGSASVQAASSRSIADEGARCFEVTDAGANVGSGTICFSERGVPLLMEFESPDGDFEVPFPLTSLGVLASARLGRRRGKSLDERHQGSFVALSAEVQLRRANSGARAQARQNAATSFVKIS